LFLVFQIHRHPERQWSYYGFHRILRDNSALTISDGIGLSRGNSAFSGAEELPLAAHRRPPADPV
jgi:hypothetical protein